MRTIGGSSPVISRTKRMPFDVSTRRSRGVSAGSVMGPCPFIILAKFSRGEGGLLIRWIEPVVSTQPLDHAETPRMLTPWLTATSLSRAPDIARRWAGGARDNDVGRRCGTSAYIHVPQLTTGSAPHLPSVPRSGRRAVLGPRHRTSTPAEARATEFETYRCPVLRASRAHPTDQLVRGRSQP